MTGRTALVAAALLLASFALAQADELKIDVLYKPDSCDRVTKEYDYISVHYRGTLTDGTVFDSSFERDEPFQFTLGAGDVIQGWDQGLLGACVGEKRKLMIPSDLGYGDEGAGPIPPGATLIFETEVLDISEGGDMQEDPYAGYGDEHAVEEDDEYAQTE